MHKYFCLAATILIVAIIAFGCSTGSSPTEPVLNDNLAPRDSSGTGQIGLLGLWQVVVDLDNQTIEAVPARTSDLILNVLGFMEPPALDKMTIDFDTLVIDFENTTVQVDVIFSHPLVTPENAFQGFDVRGIAFGPTLLNPDGYTAVMNPADFADVPFGYIDGLLGAPHSYANYDADYWPYKYFCDDLDADTELRDFYFNHTDIAAHRGKFSEGETHTRHYDLSWVGLEDPINYLVFNYAVYANFDWAEGEPTHSTDDYPITTANSAEAFCMSYEEVENLLTYWEGAGYGNISLDIRIWDWQGHATTEVTIETIETGVIMPVTETTSVPGLDPFDAVYTFFEVPGVPTTTGELDILVTVKDNSMTYGEAWFFELLPTDHPYYDLQVESYWIITVPVNDISPCPTQEPVDLEDAPYYGIWVDDLTEDTACAYEVSNLTGTDMEWVHDPLTNTFRCEVPVAPYDDNVYALLIGPEILLPSTGAMEIQWNFTAVLDDLDVVADGTGVGFLIEGNPYSGILNQTASVANYDMGFVFGGPPPGTVIQPCIWFHTDDALNMGTGAVFNYVTTTVFDPGPLPIVSKMGGPNPANEICKTGNNIISWGSIGEYPGDRYVRYTGIPYRFAYPPGFTFTWAGIGLGGYMVYGDGGWMNPTNHVNNYEHHPCEITLGPDGWIVFGDYLASISGGEPTPTNLTGFPDRAGELRWQGLDIDTLDERYVVQWCDLGQLGEKPASTANFRCVINGDDNNDPGTIYFEYLDVGTHDQETQPETDTGSYMIYNGVYVPVFCDGENWADNMAFRIIQP